MERRPDEGVAGGRAGVPAEVHLRSLALQGSWNRQRMQNLGLLVCLLPWLRRRPTDFEQRRRFCLRHYEFFNTNPYLANLIVGGLLRLENDADPADRRHRRLMAGFKSSLAWTLASLGDQFFWLGLRPSLLILAVLAAWLGPWWSPLAIVGLFAIGQVELRRRLLRTGFDLGLDIVDLLGRPGWHRAIGNAKIAGMALTGALLGLHLERITGADASVSPAAVPETFLLGAGLTLLFRKRIPGEGIFLLAAMLALALPWI